MNLSDLRPAEGSRKKRKRIGRGPGSGWGKTAGRGEKGQKSRTGYSRTMGFEGGQMPLIRRVPKRGFHNVFRKEYTTVNLSRLNELEGDSFSAESLLQAKVIRKLQSGLKILGDGEITRAVTVEAHKFTASAKQKIEAAGGKVVFLGGEPEPAVEAPKAPEKNATAKARAPKAEEPEEAAPEQAAPKKKARKAKGEGEELTSFSKPS